VAGRRTERRPGRRGGARPTGGRTAAAAAGGTGALRGLARAVSRRGLPIAIALAAVHVLLGLASFQPTPHTGGDNAAYLSLAQSLLEDGRYRNLYDPNTPPHTQYPPVFPGILALALALGLKPWVQLKLVVLGFAAAAVAFTFLWIRRRRRPLLALGVGAALAVGPGALELGHWVLSDVPFWTLTAVALWAFERLRPGERRRLAVAVAATTLAYFTRSAGLPLVVAAFAWLALRRRWTQVAALAVVLGPLALLWWLRARGLGGVDYVSQFWSVNPYDPSQGRIGMGDLFGRMAENAGKYARLHLPILLTGTSGGASIALGAGVIGFGLFGWLRRLRRPGAAELFLPLYLGLLLLWPAVWSGERFLLPAFPLLLAYAGEGVVRLGRVLQPVAAPWAAAVAAAVVLLAALPGTADQVRSGRFCTGLYRAGDPWPCLTPAWREYYDTAVWAGRSLPPGAAVVTRKPRLFWGLSGGVPAVIFPFSTDAAAFFAAADTAGARYLVLDRVDGLSSAYVTPIVLRRPQAFCILYASPLQTTAVLGILDGAAAMPDAATDAERDVVFPICPEPFWRDPGERERLLGRGG
jgi:hypothetical protein